MTAPNILLIPLFQRLLTATGGQTVRSNLDLEVPQVRNQLARASGITFMVNRFSWQPSEKSAHSGFRSWLTSVGVPAVCTSAGSGDLFDIFAPGARA